MDSAHSHPLSPPSTSTVAHATAHLRPSATPSIPNRSKRHSEPPASRQSRLLQYRNARFPTKKLSLSNLSSRFSQLIHANDESQTIDSADQDQENIFFGTPEDQPHSGFHVSPNSLGILDEISNSTVRKRKSRQVGNIAVYQDTPERPLLQRSPISSPAVYQDTSTEDPSPIGFDHIQDSLGSMRLREISGNEFRGSPCARSPRNGSIKGLKRRKVSQIKAGYDTQDYIDHIERQLQEAQNELFSPTSNKSLKDQLRAARQEIEQLNQEMVSMRDVFEAEVKKSIENKTEMEVELKRRVRDLEDELELKVTRIKDLELQHDENRLNDNTIDNLKAAVEKLEHHKLALEEENRSMSKRNEVLSELLAMSPTKIQTYDLKSPTREKRRAGRPMSMIIPRLPSSPNGTQLSQPASLAASPASSIRGPSHVQMRSRGGSPRLTNYGLGLSDCENLDTMHFDPDQSSQDYFSQFDPTKPVSRRSTLHSQSSLDETSSITSNVLHTFDQSAHRVLPKRKPRKFMSGSTQLKPLLLPALTGDGGMLSSASTTTSPLLEAAPNARDQLLTQSLLSFRPVKPTCDEADHHTEISVLDEEGSSANTLTAFRSFKDDIDKSDEGALFDTSSDAESNISSVNSTSPAACVVSLHHSAENWNDALHTTSHGPLDSFSAEKHITFPQTTCRRISLDLQAIRQLELPSPRYDKFPDADVCTNDVLLNDIPQPLFSASGNTTRGQPRRACYSAPPDQYSSEQLRHIGESHESLQLYRTPNTDTVAPSPKIHSSSRDIVTRNFLDHQSSPMSNNTFPHQRMEVLKDFTPKTKEPLGMTKSPLEILRSSNLGARPLAALTIKTIFGTIAQCTSQVKDFKSNPWAMARRVLANAWFSNWKRFGKMSWWVLGLFISSGFGGPKFRKWDWAKYDGEEIAYQICEPSNEIPPIHDRSTLIPRSQQICRTSDATGSIAKPKQKDGWGRTVMLWGKFSVAIMLAVGGAVVKGPGEMLKDLDDPSTTHLDETEISFSGDIMTKHHRNSEPSHSPSIADIEVSSRQDSLCQNQTTRPESWSSPVEINENIMDCSIHRRAPNLEASTSSLNLAEDDTIRAIPSPRRHIADYFQYGAPVSRIHHERSLKRNSQEHLGRPTEDQTIKSSFLRWPPSPGVIFARANEHLG